MGRGRSHAHCQCGGLVVCSSDGITIRSVVSSARAQRECQLADVVREEGIVLTASVASSSRPTAYVTVAFESAQAVLMV